jgi:D-serine deaminase-like pyridoxal phosphate-dependent protein
VHSIEREKIARRLNDSRPPELPPLNVLIQVNVSGEASKSGVAPGEERALAEAIRGLPRLRLRGLMTIPEPTLDADQQRRRFALLHSLQQGLQADDRGVDTLSMGMSDDLEAAIAEGSTMVRIGTAALRSEAVSAPPSPGIAATRPEEHANLDLSASDSNTCGAMAARWASVPTTGTASGSLIGGRRPAGAEGTKISGRAKASWADHQASFSLMRADLPLR